MWMSSLERIFLDRIFLSFPERPRPETMRASKPKRAEAVCSRWDDWLQAARPAAVPFLVVASRRDVQFLFTKHQKLIWKSCQVEFAQAALAEFLIRVR
jgi:hypothetical protein